MKISRKVMEDYRKEGMSVIKQVMIPSQSILGKYYLVKVYEDGTMECKCEAGGKFHIDCGHKKRMREMLLNNEI